MDRRKLEIIKMCKGLGLKVESFVQSRNHFHVTVSNGICSRKTIFPVSASDHRWRLNKRSEIRQLFKQGDNP